MLLPQPDVLLPTAALPVVPKALPELAHEVVVGGLGLVAAELPEQGDEVVGEPEARERRHDGLELLGRDQAVRSRRGGVVVVRAEEVREHAAVRQRHLGLLVLGYALARVQRDGVPDELQGVVVVVVETSSSSSSSSYIRSTNNNSAHIGAVLVIVGARRDRDRGGEAPQEAPGAVRAVDLEALVGADEGLVGGPAQVVEQDGDEDELDRRRGPRQVPEAGHLGQQDQREVRGPHAVRVRARRGVLAQVGHGGEREGRVGERHVDGRERGEVVGLLLEGERLGDVRVEIHGGLARKWGCVADYVCWLWMEEGRYIDGRAWYEGYPRNE